jgi:hypothetical protein
MSTEPDSTEPPEGFETREQRKPLPEDGDRPDWLVGAADVLGDREEAPVRPLAPVPPPKTASPASPLSVVPGGKPERPTSWSGAASSVPKLSLVPSQGPASSAADDDWSAQEPDSHLELAAPVADLDSDSSPSPAPTPAPFKPLDEPWYLVWGEALLTNRKVQGLALLGLALLAVAVFFPRHRQPGASLHGILREPARFEGRSVVVRGEVLESFDLGQGYAFNLRQGRDTVVVFSRSRRPDLHQRIEVVGTVSTGYLDGEPRVAIFEGAQ